MGVWLKLLFLYCVRVVMSSMICCGWCRLRDVCCNLVILGLCLLLLMV